MGIEKMGLLANESVYLINMSKNIENTVKQCVIYMGYQQTQPCEKIIPYKMPHKPWEMVSADIFTIKNNALFYIVDY